MFMGMATDALMWPQSLIDALVSSGYEVIRYDYRGTGESDWVEAWRETPYSLADLAKDAKVILDTLQISKVHLVGMSMGGMVAQEFALSNPDKTLSLTSIMSSGDIFDEELPQASTSMVLDFTMIGIGYGLIPSEHNTIRMMLAAQIILRGDATYDIDVKATAERVLYNLRKRKGYNPDASAQHNQTAKLWTSRFDQLKDLTIPVLIIHGLNDPLVSIEHSRKLASAIPKARTRWFDNMGHDLPPNLIEQLVKEIVSNATSKND